MTGELKEKAARYSKAFDGASPLANEMNRARKAAKIQAVLDAELAFDRPAVRILDIGCSFGIILDLITPYDGFGVGIDLDTSLGRDSSKLAFVRADAENLPFDPGSFDIVVCNHVYEHTDNVPRLLSEIHRVMSAEGLCYFAGPNKFELVEPHYRLPFLSWLPRSIADRYMRLAGKGDSYPEKPASHRQLREFLQDFDVIDYTGKVVGDPERFNAADILPPRSLKLGFAKAMLRFAPFFFPGFIYILRKRIQ